jgi:hypothetical protein
MINPERWDRWTFIVAYITMIATVGCLFVAIASYNHSNSDVNTNTGGTDIGSDNIVGYTNIIGDNNKVGDANTIIDSNTVGDNNKVGNENKIYKVNTFGSNNAIGNKNNIANNLSTSTNQGHYDDETWLKFVHNHTDSLNSEMNGILIANNVSDFPSLENYSVNMVLESIDVMHEEKNFSISPKYNSANEELVDGLQDYMVGANKVRVAAIEGQEGNANVGSMLKAIDLCKQGTEHIKNANNLINTSS